MMKRRAASSIAALIAVSGGLCVGMRPAVGLARAQSAGSHGPVICIDSGHPSEINDGFQLQNGATETHINWAVALKLRSALAADGYRVVMTKSSERQRVKNERRAAIANGAHARLMVRLHCDTGTGTGWRVFYPVMAGRHGGVTGPSAWVREESGKAAEAVHAALAEKLGEALHDNGMAGDRLTAVGRKQGALIGSIHSQVPTVLIEMVFLNNRKDALFIKSEEGQARMAGALAAGVEGYVGKR